MTTNKKTTSDDKMDLRSLSDMPVQVSVVIGQVSMKLGDLMQKNKGDLINLDNLADDKVDILVNDKLVARGEVVVNGEKIGVTLSDIVN